MKCVEVVAIGTNINDTVGHYGSRGGPESLTVRDSEGKEMAFKGVDLDNAVGDRQ